MRTSAQARLLHRRVLDWMELGSYTQGCAADAIGVSDSLIGQWVRGEQFPSVLNAALIEQDILELKRRLLRERGKRDLAAYY